MAGASASLEYAAFLRGFADLGLVGMAMEVERGDAQTIVDRAKSLVHVGGADDPMSGQTRDSLAWGNELHPGGEGVDAKGSFIDVGSMLEKAFYEEFGSIHGAAVHFLEIAIAEVMGGSGKAAGVVWSAMHRPAHIKSSRINALSKLTKL